MPKIVDHEERRREIVEAMWRVVEQAGFAAVSIRSVAAEAGMSKAAIGHYFPKRSDVIASAVERDIGTVTSELVELDLDTCTIDVAVAALMVVIPTTEQRRRHSQVWLSLLAAQDPDPDISRSLTHLNVTVRVGLMVVLRAFRKQGGVAASRDLLVESARLHALVDGLSLQALTDPTTMPPGQVETLVRLHLEDLAQPR